MKKFSIIFLIFILFLISCSDLGNLRKEVDERLLNKKTDDLEVVDSSLNGRNAELNVKLASAFPNKFIGNDVKFSVGFGKSDFLKFDGDPTLIQTLYVPNEKHVNQFSSSEILDSVEKKKTINSRFEVKTDRIIPAARLTSELQYKGYNRAKFNGCLVSDSDNYISYCGEFGDNLVSIGRVSGSEVKVKEISVFDYGANSNGQFILFHIVFAKVKKGDLIGDIDFSFENFPFSPSFDKCRASLSEKESKTINFLSESEGETYCKIYLSGLNFEENKKFEGYLWMRYDFKLTDDLTFMIEPKT